HGPEDAFTLHGLWPDTCSGGQGTSDGRDSFRAYLEVEKIVRDANSTLYYQMKLYWSSYNGDNGIFW
ncbi:hypothetical protein K493DRAFT_238910, partial [Basidiobolus meristosporus CBS 931.73]